MGEGGRGISLILPLPPSPGIFFILIKVLIMAVQRRKRGKKGPFTHDDQ